MHRHSFRAIELARRLLGRHPGAYQGQHLVAHVGDRRGRGVAVIERVEKGLAIALQLARAHAADPAHLVQRARLLRSISSRVASGKIT